MSFNAGNWLPMRSKDLYRSDSYFCSCVFLVTSMVATAELSQKVESCGFENDRGNCKAVFTRALGLS